MGVDYYIILDITRSATIADIHKSYRKLSLKYHPDKCTEVDAAEKFLRIAEAYDVLKDPMKRGVFDQFKEEGLKNGISETESDARKRAVYDQFGEEGLKNGVPEGSGSTGAWTQGYTFHGNAEKVFRDFFGGDNCFHEFHDKIDGDLIMSFGGLKGRGRKKQDQPIERELILSLEEVYHGCTKKMKISRRVMNIDGHTSSVKDKILTITVKPGWTPDTRITFQMEGDQGPNNFPADIVFIVKDKPHEFFRREGINLIYKANISLGKALTNHMVDILTLDGRVLHIPINDIVCPGYVKTVPGEGMPIVGCPEKKGDLRIEFNIIFPRTLTQHKKDLVASALL